MRTSSGTGLMVAIRPSTVMPCTVTASLRVHWSVSTVSQAPQNFYTADVMQTHTSVGRSQVVLGSLRSVSELNNLA